MRQRAFWMFVALLVALLAATGVALGSSSEGRSAAASDPWAEKDFDDLFNEQFFSRQRDPVAEMLEFQNWFGDRMGLPAIQEKTRETDKEVVVELKISGLDKDSLGINVNGASIRVAYDAEKLEDKKDGSGREIFKSESVRHFEKIMPIPEDADPRKSRIAREGDVVKIIFPKKEGSVKADA